jgi:hypothetical protein
MSEHHPSCKPSDRDLVWLCSQCGGHESAESLLSHAEQLAEVLRDIADFGRSYGLTAENAVDGIRHKARAALADLGEMQELTTRSACAKDTI